MKLLIARHADPDYSIDSLTEVGWKGAALLADRISRLEVAAFYVSPLGRAKDTASLTLQKMGRTAVECPWLREFDAPIRKPGAAEDSIPWDWMPADWTAEPRFFDRRAWADVPVMDAGGVGEKYRAVTGALDELLAAHGYRRQGEIYRAERPNTDTVVLFCHFGVECVLLSHLLGLSPLVLWQGACAAPSSLTTLITEERRQGDACFRMGAFGDTSHLYAGGREPSFAGRFCEMYSLADQRH